MDDDPKLVALRFHAAINERDLDGLVALMTDDHVFLDSAQHVTRGKDAVREAWRGFFAAFPDYRNEVDEVRQHGAIAVMVGRSTCREAALHGPALWSARVRNGRVAEWRVYVDSEGARRTLGLAR